MGIEDIQISEELETNAPSIRYRGDEGPRSPQQEQQMMEQQMMEQQMINKALEYDNEVLVESFLDGVEVSVGVMNYKNKIKTKKKSSLRWYHGC